MKAFRFKRSWIIAGATTFAVPLLSACVVLVSGTLSIAAAPPPVATVFVSRTSGEIEQVTVSSGAHTVVGSTGANADSLLFESSGKLIVSGLGSPNVFRIDPTLPGGAANVGTQVNTTSLSGGAADEAIDASGLNLYVTDFGNSVDVVDLATGAVTPHSLTGFTGFNSGIAFDASGQLWVTDYSAGTVGIADLTANTYTPLCTGVAVGAGGADGLSFDPSTGLLYVSGQATNTITALTIGTNSCSVGTVFPMGLNAVSNLIQPDGLAADGLGNIFVAGQNGDVAILDTTTGMVTIIASGILSLDDIAPVFGQGAPVCGNGIVDPGEDCDGSANDTCPDGCLPPGDANQCQCAPPQNVCGDNVVGTGEQCDGTDDAACPGLCLPPGDPNQCTCPVAASCGNGIIDAGETCDPPGSPAGGSGNLCRSDCTVCGDGVIQSGDGETCDDGNDLECDPVHPQKALDDCNNSCQGLMCKDPARVTRTGGLDVLHFHARMIPIAGRSMSFSSNDVSLSLTAGSNLVFGTSVPSGAIGALTSGAFTYRNAAARHSGGIYKVKALPARNGTYKVTMIALGDLSGAAGDMVTHVTIGAAEWSVHGLWTQTGSGWVLNGRP